MAVCSECGGEMLDRVSCKADPIMIDGQAYEPIRWGEEERSKRWTLPDHCRDCYVPVGGVHHPGCCVERCPVCLGQAFGCPCFMVDELVFGEGDEDGYQPSRARRCTQHLFRQSTRG